MARLEELTPGTRVTGVAAGESVAVVSVEWHGSDALTLVYRLANGLVADEILYRHDEPRLGIGEAGRPWSCDGDGALFRLVAEGHRIRFAQLFDSVLAVDTSLVDPLPYEQSDVTTGFNGASVSFPLDNLLSRAEAPR